MTARYMAGHKGRTEGTELRWVPCEACGGSGEIQIAAIVGAYNDPTPYGELCSVCQGTGRDCVEVFPVERNDDRAATPFADNH